MRSVLRYVKTVVTCPRQRQSHMILRAYVDASWGRERSVERRSLGRVSYAWQGMYQDMDTLPTVCCSILCRERAVCTCRGFQEALGVVMLWDTS